MQRARHFEAEIVKKVAYNYLLHLPPDYGEDPTKRWPLILFLHGAGERGSDLKKLKVNGIPKIVEEQPDFPFITVSPQCPEDHWWPAEVEGLLALLDDVMVRYAVDPDRVYLTGLSMGGYGTWTLAVAAPDRFAAIAPICGGLYGPARMVERLKNVPVWAFHGAKDPVVPLEQSERLVKVLQEVGGQARLTVYPEAEHDSWTETYANPELYAWFLAHRRGA